MRHQNNRNINNLNKKAQRSLFITSYIPLFGLLILKQVSINIEYLEWGGVSLTSVSIFVEKFGLSFILLMITIWGIGGAKATFTNLEKRILNGFPIKITNIKERSSESINYIATYIMPFLFQSFDGWVDLVSIIIILLIIYRIYINSTLLLVNPILNLFYGFYEIEYGENGIINLGYIIIRNKLLVESDKIKIYPIGHKMFYAKEI